MCANAGNNIISVYAKVNGILNKIYTNMFEKMMDVCLFKAGIGTKKYGKTVPFTQTEMYEFELLER